MIGIRILAAIEVRDEIQIAKDRTQIWTLLTEISSWNRWAKVVKHAAVYGPIKAGTEFKFISGKWDFDGAIIEVAPQESLVLDARSVGLHLRFSWMLAQRADGINVSANIAASGWIATLLKRRVSINLEDDLFSWLYALKTTAERGDRQEATAIQGLAKPRRNRHLSGPLGFLFRKNNDDE